MANKGEITQYSSREKAVLTDMPPVENFGVRGFSFINTAKNIVIPDAITISDEGEVTFRDKETEISLTQLIQEKDFITEETDANGNTILYFQDQYNEKVSLGRMYEILFKEKILSSNHWYGARASDNLDYNFDLDILRNYYSIDNPNAQRQLEDGTLFINAYDDYSSLSPTSSTYSGWKNKWHDIPCISVLTPEYVDGIYASISAVIPVKLKVLRPIYMGFRIYDATADKELVRQELYYPTMFEEEIVNIPLTYQGPMPDSPVNEVGVCKEFNLRDLQNIQVEPVDDTELFSESDRDYISSNVKRGREKGIDIFDEMNTGIWKRVPTSKHLIKLQWTACNAVGMWPPGVSDIVQTQPASYRAVTSDAETSLDVNLFAPTITRNDFIQFTGQLALATTDPKVKSKWISLETIPALDTNYTVITSSDKNINTWVSVKNESGFVLNWNVYDEESTIDWCLVQYVTRDSDPSTRLDSLNDKTRVTNHELFLGEAFAADFCCQFETDFGPVVVPTPTPVSIVETAPTTDVECTCCGCCPSLPTVKLKATGGSPVVPGEDLQGSGLFTVTDDFGNTRKYNSASDITYSPVVITDDDCQYFIQNSDDSLTSLSISTSVIRQGDTVSIVSAYSCEVTDRVRWTGQGDDVDLNTFTTSFTNTPVLDSVETDEDEFAFSALFAQNTISSDELDQFFLDYNDRLTAQALTRSGDEDRDALPASLVSDNKIILDAAYDEERFGFAMLSGGDGALRQYSNTADISFLVTDDQFLGRTVFGNNIVIVELNPSYDISDTSLPIFPGFDPIGAQEGLDEILDYIYSVVYPPGVDVPVFPNFKVGDVAIDGTRYNPLFDIRNYRMLGTYSSKTDITGEVTELVFNTNSLETWSSNFVAGNQIYNELADQYYRLKVDPYTISPTLYTRINGIDYSIAGSGLKFIEEDSTLWDLNDAIGVGVEEV
jgi:hypothetical protein